MHFASSQLADPQDVASIGWDTIDWYFIVDPADCDCGYMTENVNKQGTAIRFRNITVPKGAKIAVAILRFCAFSNYDVDYVRQYINAELNANPLPFTTIADYWARQRAPWGETWDEIRHWSAAEWYPTSNFASQIQQVIDLPDWESGNSIVVFCNDHGNRSDHIPVCARHAYAYHINPEKAPWLLLTYTLPDEPTPPPVPEGKWSIEKIEQILTATGYKIVVTTDVPCHLYMRWTTVKPQEHLIPVERRGLFLHSDKYFCFDAYKDNQQEEDDDTIVHTFIKEPWPACQTRYFYFHGTISGIASPSTSPIFTKHRVAPPYGPPETHEYPCYPYDGFFYATATGGYSEYTVLWHAATAPVYPADVSLHTRNCAYVNNVRICRSVPVFDTSAIPEGSQITEVKIRLTPRLLDWTCPTNLCITPATTCHLPLITADYHNLLDTPTILASKPFADLIRNLPFELTLSAGSHPEINPGGLTKFGIRSAIEIIMIPCMTGWQYAHVYACEESDIRRRPLLTVTYKPPL